MQFLAVLRMLIAALIKPKQKIVLSEIPPGKVLDLGGGGEGVIARAGGARVVAVDKYLSEIHEARGKSPEAAWLTADATQLPCQSQSFDLATAFFSCMYMSDEVKAGVFRETQRVLKPGGELWIWDLPMAAQNKACSIRLQVTLPEQRTISTIYGVKAKDQSAEKLCQQLAAAGFETETLISQKYWFWLKARKSAAD